MVDVARIEITAEDKASAKVDRVAGSVDRLAGSYDRLSKDAGGSLASKNELISRSFSRLDDTISGHAKGLIAAGAAYLSTSITIDKMRSAVDGMDKIDELSQKLSLNAQTLQAHAYAGKLSGVSLDDMAQAQKKLQTNMLEAITGGKEQAAVFKAMGISVRDANGDLRTTENVLLDMADVFRGLEDGPTKTGLAVKLLSKSGEQMVPFLNEGRVGVKRLTDEARDLGLVMGKDSLKAAADFNDQLDRMSALTNASFANLASAAIPAINNVMERFVAASKVVDGFWERLQMTGGITLNRALGESYGQQIKDVDREIQNIQTSNNPFNLAGKAWDYAFNNGEDPDLKKLRARKKVLQEMQSMRALEGSGAGDEDQNDRRYGESHRSKRVNAADIAASLKKSKDTDKEKITDYQRLTQSISEKIAAEQLELQVGAKLTDGQRIAAKVMVELRDNLIKLSEPEKKRVTTLLEQLIAEEKKTEAQRAAAKAAEEVVKQSADLAKAGADQVKSLSEEIDKQREHNDAIGLSKEAVERLSASKLELDAANDREMAANMRAAAVAAGPLHDAYVQYATDLLNAADAKERLAGEKRVGGAKALVAEEEEKALEARKRASEEIERGLIDGIRSGFREGDDLATIFFDELKVRAAKTILSPILRPISDATDSLLEGLIGSFGNMLLGSGGDLTIDPGGIGLSATASAEGLAAQDLLRGGREFGGPVERGSLYEINEGGTPEVLTMGDKDYVMMGSQGGYVTPTRSGGGESSIVMNSTLNLNVDSKTDRGQMWAEFDKAMKIRDAQLMEKMRRAKVIR